ncbi:MAG TPA: winged helix-turn-helix transcriptional regulator [Candidatus Caenarcaniphilales bacterium]|jgi:predicted transcriptional regulator
MEEKMRGTGGCYLSQHEIEEIVPTLKGPELQLYLQLKGIAAKQLPLCPRRIAEQLGFSLTTYYRYLKRLKDKGLLTSKKQVQVVSYIQFIQKEDQLLPMDQPLAL